MVECSNGLLVRVKVTLLSDAVFCQHERLVWFEIAPNEAITLALDFDYGTKHFTEFERKFHQNFTIALFWIESDLNMYCIQVIKQLECNNNNSTTNGTNSLKHDIA